MPTRSPGPREDQPELIVDFATLTGAARVALGPDIPALFANRDELAAAAEQAGRAVDDPLVANAAVGSLRRHAEKRRRRHRQCVHRRRWRAASLAALFLKRFVPDAVAWAHLDTYAWRDPGKPGRPKGGDALGLRAIFAMLEDALSRPR